MKSGNAEYEETLWGAAEQGSHSMLFIEACLLHMAWMIFSSA
jgi:hypothetical protein